MSYKNTDIINSNTVVTYHGDIAGNPSVAFSNYILRYNTATTNIELATNAGTDSVAVFSWAGYNFGLINMSQENINLTTAFQVVGDPGIIAGGEDRIYDISSMDFNVRKWFRVSIKVHNSGAKTSCRMHVERMGGEITSFPVAFGSVSRVTPQVMPAGAWTPIVFGTVLTSRNMAAASTNKPFQVSRAGCYTINANVHHDDNGIVSGSYMESRLTKNGAALSLAYGNDVGTGVRAQTNHNLTVDLAANDVIALECKHSTTNNNTVVAEMNINSLVLY